MLTSTQVQNVTVAMFGAAAGGYTAALQTYESEAALIAALVDTQVFADFYPQTDAGELVTAIVGTFIPEATTEQKAVAVEVLTANVLGGATVAETIAYAWSLLKAVPTEGSEWSAVRNAYESKVAKAVTFSEGSEELSLESLQAAASLAEVFTLVAGLDEVTGTAYDDTIEGVVSALTTERTLDVTDVIDGGEGTDTLSLTMTTNFAGFTADKGSMKSVEVLSLTNGSTDIAREFDATGATGIEKVTVDASNGAVNVKDLATLVAVEVAGQKSGTFTVAYDAKSAVVTSTTAKDAQSLKVTDLGTAETKADAGDEKYVTATIANVESLTVESAGTANYLNLSGVSSAASVTVTGSAATDVEAIAAATTSFDASAATGNVTADLTGAAAGKLASVATGAGDDKVTVDLTDLTVNAAIVGGAGTDALTINDGANTSALTLQPTLSGFEKVTLDALGGALTLSGKNATDLQEVQLKGGNAGLTLATAPADLVLSTTGANAISAAVTVDSASSLTINTAASAASAKAMTADAVNGAGGITASKAAALTVNVGAYTTLANAITASEASAVTVNVASGLATDGKTETSNFTSTLTAAKATSVTVDAAKLGGTIDAAKATAANITTGANDSTLTLTTAALENLTINAGKGLDLSNAATDVTKVQVADLTTAGHLTFGTEAMSGASNVTVGGAGTNAQATLGALGASTNDYGLTVTATGLAKNLSTGAIDAGNGALSVDVKGVTGTVTTGTLDSTLGLTVDASTNAKAVSFGNVTSTAGAVTIDANSAADTVNVGNVSGKGAVSVDVSSAAKQVTLGTLTGGSVTVNAAGALTGVTVGNGTTANTDITADTAVTYTGSNLKSNGLDIEASATSTALAVALTGGILNDEFTVKGGVKSTSITVTGDLDIGTTNTVGVTLANSSADTQTVNLSALKNSTNTVTIAAETDDIIVVTGSAGTADTLVLGANQDYTAAAHKLTFSAVENLTVDDTGAASTILASLVSGSTIKLTGAAANDVLVLAGTDAADTIDLSKLDNSHTGNDVNLTVSAGKGDDVITLSEGVDVVNFGDLNGKDTIASFTVNSDLLNFGGITGITVATEADVAADAAIVATAADATTYVFADGADGTGTEAIASYTDLTDVAAFLEAGLGATSAHNYVAVINDLVGDDVYVYLVDVDADNGTTNQIDAGDLTLIGVLNDIGTTALDSGDIA